MEVYRYCKVQPEGMNNKFYYYLSYEEVEADDTVIIPFGRDDHYTVGTVIDVKYYEAEEVPFPLDRMKAIYKVLQPGEIFIEERAKNDTYNPLIGQVNNYLFTGKADKAFQWAVKHQNDFHDKEIMEKVVEIYEDFTEAGNPNAALNLGAMYYNGTYLERDFQKAAALYKLAADAGNTQAMCNLGYCYYYGRHQEVDYEKAYRYFTQGAILDNNPNCLYKLGDMFQNGYYIEKNGLRAIKLYKNAYHSAMDYEDRESLADIELRLGKAYLRSNTVSKDPEVAFLHLSRALSLFYERRHTDPFVKGLIAETKKLLAECEQLLDEETI